MLRMPRSGFEPLAYHDDAEGLTRQIHVFWFGPHLDNKAKS
jgi:hypothetical protein